MRPLAVQRSTPIQIGAVRWRASNAECLSIRVISVIRRRFTASTRRSEAQPNMFRSRPDSDEPRRKRLQNRKPLHNADENRKRISSLGFTPSDNVAMNERLHRLDHPGGPFPAFLNLFQIRESNRP